MRKIYSSFVFILTFTLLTQAQRDPLQTVDSLEQRVWVEDTYKEMSLQEKIGQLFMVLVASDQSKESTDRIRDLIRQEHLGGIIFSTGGPVRQARLTNEYQSVSKIPLLIGMDAEWGLAMRLDSTFAYPWNMTLGAIRDSSLVESIGYRIGTHAKRLGVHINFAPDVDININPRNPIIGNRSFGEERENVARKGAAFVRGMSRAGVLTSAKHFPGHGDTEVDSHKDLPVIPFEKERLDSIEIYPYKNLIREGVTGVMVAHLNVPALEPDEKRPSSLSKNIISKTLKEDLGFRGLILTDALNMNGVTSFAGEDQAALEAFLAGNDILLMPRNLQGARAAIEKAFSEGAISESRLETSVKKILMAKYKAGLQAYRPIPLDNLYEDLNTIEDSLLYERAFEEAITLVKNEVDLLPIKNLENKKIAYVSMGDDSGDAFLKALQKYTKVTQITGKDIGALKKNLEPYNLVIVGFHRSNESPWKPYKFSEKELFWLAELGRQRSFNLVLSVFAKPYALLDLVNYDDLDGLVLSYQNSEIAQEKTAEIIFGAIPARGKLPVSLGSGIKAGSGILGKSLGRLGYSIPERVGMDRKLLKRVDTLVQNGIDSMMFPGAQVLVARKGKVIYDRNFGKPTYDGKDSINSEHLYDLASLTKILATLPIVMSMEEEGKISLNDTFGELIPAYDTTNLKDVTVLKALSHYGRLPSWIAFYLATLDKNRKPSPEFYRSRPGPGYSIEVTDNLYLSDAYRDSIYNRIGRQSLKSNRYRYSDVPYYVIKKYIEEKLGEPLDNLVTEKFYKPLGADHTRFRPLDYFERERIVPSEIDNYYRYQTVQGYVHDMGAAMQGGVGGHAGLFSNANDVAKIMQMYLQGGYYGGDRLLQSRTIEKFNKCYFCNEDVRRGVGFDKPQLEPHGPTCGCVSRKSFGHSGFTGTYTWADPEEEIVYVFLSNRTYPSSTNNLLIKSELRTRIQQAIYDSIIK
ncbi:beta-glucosidase [Muriicola jejuensis]|uniref:beta-N-acetylhexosaminidase n=1 Tax=Muriicola jejuensis TaxID=504488 RepID=A0A6P0UEW9_9FLAO|nr:glycoside hydrolase family 3 N-terminal domain-containing protein [Muriicola jejuensis]NER11557.1 serine hydrolase [Muriicola jejuensis]SMP19712.1 beta-glucosidase [Muriicola jejuensis]